MKFNDIFAAACSLAPIELSDALVAAMNGYDNSGVILETDRDVKKVLFTLDMSPACAEYAIANGYELIITHHPAIYTPIKRLDYAGTGDLLRCAQNGIGVISMHLNLDVAENGIDQSLAVGLGAKKPKILTPVLNGQGYGRMFNIEKTTLADFKARVMEVFETDNVMIYGNRERELKKIASFCGAGCDIAQLDLADGADAVVSADFKHHVIREALNRGLCVVQMTHYASESYGMKVFASMLSKELSGVKTAFYGTAEF